MMKSHFVKKFWQYSMLLLLSCSFLIASPESSSTEQNPVTATLIAENQSIQPNTPFTVAIRLSLDDHWHSYWKNPGDVGYPIQINWDLPEGYSVEEIMWPTPKRYEVDSIIGYGYEEEVTLLCTVTPNSNSDQETTLKADVAWLACSDTTCLPGDAKVSLSLPVKNSVPVANTNSVKLIQNAKEKLPQKNWGTLSAIRSKDQVEIVLTTPENTSLSHTASFFPEEQEMFDDKIAASITSCGEESNTYIIALKEFHEGQNNASRIKGVLTINDDKTAEVIQSIEVDIPIEASQNNDTTLISMNEPITTKATHADEEYSPFEGGFFFYLLTAFAGGMLLNLMPCVLPVISLKIMSFVNMASSERKKILLHGVSFSIGVLLSFWVLAGALLALQAYGHAVGWGFQLQQPIVIAILATIILVFGLSMFGVFEFGTSLSAMAGQAEVKSKGKKETFTGSFFSGILATAVATPCTGPFLGPAVGFAVTQTPFMSMLIFTSLGLGMAFPYLLLSAFPKLLKFLPKPGNWMITFKEITGFIMMAVVIWLLWIYGAQTDSIALFMMLASLLTVSLGCWIYGKWATPVRKKRTRIIGTLATIVCLALAGKMAYTASTAPFTTLDDTRPVSLGDQHLTEQWVKFDPVKLDELQAKGVPVLVDFTAKWCLICQANHLVLSVDQVDKKLQELGVVKMKADWTRHDPEITAFLKKYGRNGVPLYLLYSGDSEKQPEILPQVLTPDIVLKYLDTLQMPVAMENEQS